jgi:hypothetical protein
MPSAPATTAWLNRKQLIPPVKRPARQQWTGAVLKHGVRVRFRREFSSFQTASGVLPARSWLVCYLVKLFANDNLQLLHSVEQKFVGTWCINRK